MTLLLMVTPYFGETRFCHIAFILTCFGHIIVWICIMR